jgi:SAM-dependent methyltransferase
MPRAKADVPLTNPLKLHIGCGTTMLDGFVNIDMLAGCDVTLNLNHDRLPFDDHSVDCIFSYHALEHIENYLFALGEMWRVLKHGGTFLAETPYVTLTEYNLVNPFHVRHFNEYSFDFFETGRLRGSANENTPISFKKVWHRFHYLPGFERVPKLALTFFRRHLFNVVRAIDFGLYAVKEADSELAVSEDAARRLQIEFDQIVSARRPAIWS